MKDLKISDITFPNNKLGKIVFAGTLILYLMFYLGLHHYFKETRIFFYFSSVILVVILIHRPKMVASIIIKPMLILFLLFVLSTIFSSYIRYSLDILDTVIRISLIAFFPYALISSKNRLYIFLLFWLSYHDILVIRNLIRASLVFDRVGASGLASTSFLGDANDFALALNIALPFAYYLMIQTNKKILKVFSIGTIFLLIAGIVQSNSRGGLITLFVISILICLQQKTRVQCLVILLILWIGFFYSVPSEVIERFNTIRTGEAFEENDTGGKRIILAITGLKMMLDHPITGVGLGRYPYAYGTLYRPNDDNAWRVAHNSYMTMGAEVGVIGLMSYLYLIFCVFKENYAIRKALQMKTEGINYLSYISRSITVGLTAYCVETTALTAWYYIHLFLLISLTLLIKKIMIYEYGIQPEDECYKIKTSQQGQLS